MNRMPERPIDYETPDDYWNIPYLDPPDNLDEDFEDGDFDEDEDEK